MDWTSLIGPAVGAVGALGRLFGDGDSEQRKLLAKQKQENEDWYNRRYNEDATQRADAQRLLQITEDSLKKRNKAAAGREAVMGGPTEATAREKAAGTEMMADTVGKIAAAGEARKDAIEQQYMNRKASLANQEAALEQQAAANRAKGLEALTTTAGNIAGAFTK